MKENKKIEYKKVNQKNYFNPKNHRKISSNFLKKDLKNNMICKFEKGDIKAILIFNEKSKLYEVRTWCINKKLGEYIQEYKTFTEAKKCLNRSIFVIHQNKYNLSFL